MYEDESADRQQQPIREAIGHVTDDDGYTPPALEYPTERATPAAAMRASDMDSLSGQFKKPEGGSDQQESQAPPEPHIPQRDRKTIPGPLSERDKQLLQERRRYEIVRPIDRAAGNDGDSVTKGVL